MEFGEAEAFVIKRIKKYQEKQEDLSTKPHMQPAEITVPETISTPTEIRLPNKQYEPYKPKTAGDLREDPLANVQIQEPEVVPVAQEGGEDLLLQDFRKRKEDEKKEDRVKDMTKRFFQEPEKKDGEVTVEDMLNQIDDSK